jgi:hypothetical protein
MSPTAAGRVLIGADVLEIMTVAMYAEPLVIYRELIQNAADGIERAIREGHLPERGGRIDVTLDHASRSVTIRDNGFGLPNEEFVGQMLALGASAKRGDKYRGFRGIGRLAGVGHFKEIAFRSRSTGDQYVMEVRWNSVRVRDALRSETIVALEAVVDSATTISQVAATTEPAHFFEVQLVGARRLPDDRLISHHRIASYLAEVAPVAFAPDFKHGQSITNELARRMPLLEVALTIGSDAIYKPYADAVPVRRDRFATIKGIEFIEVPSTEDVPAALGWIAHTDYVGALSRDFGGRGLRVRSGNVQVGDETILSAIFPEERFNAWAQGEFHVFDPRLRPNARRDAFEPGLAVDDLFNRLLPYGSTIARQCRVESRQRRFTRRSHALMREAQAMERAFRGKRALVAPLARGIVACQLQASIESLRQSATDVSSQVFSENLRAAEACVKKMLSLRRGRRPVTARMRGQLDVLAWLHKAGHPELIEPLLQELRE